jgi:hypothetical protein
MKTHKIALMALASMVLIAMQARGHDPSEHTSEVKDPDCSAVHSMTAGPSSAEDPVMQAMMMRCGASIGNPDDMKEKVHLQEVKSDVPDEEHHGEKEHQESH